MTGSVFISYRREGSSGAARLISDRLKARLGTNNVFIDVTDILPGVDWHDRLTAAVNSCEILLTVIGTNWLTCTDTNGARRLDDPNDYVRIEIETALNRDIPVVPVLVERAVLPKSDNLPDSLKKLPFRQGTTITPERFYSDSDLLGDSLDKILTKQREDTIWAERTENQKKIFSVVTESNITYLIDTIVQEFTKQEVDNIVLLTLGQEHYDKCADYNSGNLCDIRKLVEHLIGRRILFQFLNAIKTAKPTIEALAKALEPFGSMLHSPTESQVVSDVRSGLQVLNELRDDPSAPVIATERIGYSEKHLTSLGSDLEKLRAYKILHDTLQKMQMTIYPQLRQLMIRLRVEDRGLIVDQIRTHIDSLTILVQEAARGANALKDIPARCTPEKKWINNLTVIIGDLESALQNDEIIVGEHARRAVLQLRNLIRTNPVRVNQVLREAAETLPLKDLMSLFTQISLISELSIRQKYVLDVARASLEFLYVSLQSRVALHSQWQDLETELWGADDEFEQEAPTVSDEISALWYNIRQKIEPLWNLDPGQEWVLTTKQYATAFESFQNTSGDEFRKAKYNYDRFKFHARRQFFSVDGALGDFCGGIVKIGEPITDLTTRAE
jgi:hypothetical protein